MIMELQEKKRQLLTKRGVGKHYITGFEDGVNWQRNNVWHDCEEIPKMRETIILYDIEHPYPDVGYLTETGFYFDTGWMDWNKVNLSGTKWAYFSDLMAI